jgi:hypothetical protein
MDADLKWLLGLIVTFCITLLGVFRNLSDKIALGDAELHRRINDVKEKYARRDDLAAHITRFETQLRAQQVESKSQSTEILKLLAEIKSRE